MKMHPTIYGNTHHEVMDLEIHLSVVEKGGVHQLFNFVT